MTNPNPRLRILIIFVGTALLLGTVGWGFYKLKYPYGRTHRCSKILGMFVAEYAREHDGVFPSSDEPDALGLSALLDENPHVLELIVGKAGDLEKAEEFYRVHGYLKPEHSSWHYVPGLTSADEGRALMWDKIPLGHNGQRTDGKFREVIMVEGSVKNIPAEQWEKFVDSQTRTDAKTD